MHNTLQKIALVQCYIGHKKNIDIDIKPPINLGQHIKLDKAYAIALSFFNN